MRTSEAAGGWESSVDRGDGCRLEDEEAGVAVVGRSGKRWCEMGFSTAGLRFSFEDGEDETINGPRPCLVPIKFFRFFVTSIFRRIHKILNIDENKN